MFVEINGIWYMSIDIIKNIWHNIFVYRHHVICGIFKIIYAYSDVGTGFRIQLQLKSKYNRI